MSATFALAQPRSASDFPGACHGSDPGGLQPSSAKVRRVDGHQKSLRSAEYLLARGLPAFGEMPPSTMVSLPQQHSQLFSCRDLGFRLDLVLVSMTFVAQFDNVLGSCRQLGVPPDFRLPLLP